MLQVDLVFHGAGGVDEQPSEEYKVRLVRLVRGSAYASINGEHICCKKNGDSSNQSACICLNRQALVA